MQTNVTDDKRTPYTISTLSPGLEINFLRDPPTGLTGRTFDVEWCLA